MEDGCASRGPSRWPRRALVGGKGVSQADVMETRPGFFASYTMRCAVHGDGCVKVQGTWHCPRCREEKEARRGQKNR